MKTQGFVARGFEENTLRQYLAAVLSAGVALAVRGLLSQFVANSHPYTTLFIATAFSVWYTGLWPSVVTSALGWLGANFFFVAPFHSLRITTREERNSAIAYFLISLAVILWAISFLLPKTGRDRKIAAALAIIAAAGFASLTVALLISTLVAANH